MNPVQTVRKPLSLALQGGGAHGAFTWGVLDALLADERIAISDISGTSAGSVNAVLTAYGLEHGGAAEAQRLLRHFWERLAQCGLFSPWQPTMFDKLWGNHNLDFSPMFMGMDYLSRFFSPYQLNPLGLNPLRELLVEMVDFAALRRCRHVGVYLTATNVMTCGLKIFSTPEITVDAVLASSCLPFLFKAVEIDGQHYWDGGYMGNPTLSPLIHATDARDILIVQIDPITRKTVPKTSAEIIDRVNEISFNSSLIHELHGLMRINKLLKANPVLQGAEGLRHLYLHMVQDEVLMDELSYASKMNTDYDFLCKLHDAGQQAARQWLANHFEAIGQESTFDLTQMGDT